MSRIEQRRRASRHVRAAAVGLLLALAVGSVGAGPSPLAAAGPTALGSQSPTEPPGDDTPLPTNPISSSLDDIELASVELDARRGELDAAESQRDGTIAERDGHRQHLLDLAAERERAVALAEQLRWAEVQAGIDRERAVGEHHRLVGEAEAASRRLGRARDDLRELMIDAYTGGTSELAETLTLASGQGRANDTLLRAHLSEANVAGRVAEVEDRIADLDLARAARNRALVLRRVAEQAERAAIAARVATEDRIVAIDGETLATIAAEAEARERLERDEAAVLVALDRVAPARLRADVVGPGLDFQMVALDAWVKAAAGAPCRLEWWALAGISKIEGRHGTFGGGRLDARGRPRQPIIGPQLNGSNGFARILDTDGGRYDGDTAFDRAVGPMQFIPSTWARWGRDGDGDGQTDPHTFYDATAAAAAYLCFGRSDLTDEAQLRGAYFSYNHSLAYVEAVLAAARGYQAALTLAPHEADEAP